MNILNSSYKKQFGIVALLDYLGVSKMEIETGQLQEWLLARDNILKYTKRESEKSRRELIASAQKMFPEYYNRKGPPNQIKKDVGEWFAYPIPGTFQDTIVITHPANNILSRPLQYKFVHDLLINLMIGSLKHKFLVRGAISIGPFINDEKSNTVVGPAVANAAEWYEKAQWGGIIVTPESEELVHNLFQEAEKHGDPKKEREIKLTFFRYPVPIKEMVPRGDKCCEELKTKELLALNWPIHMYASIAGQKKKFRKGFEQRPPRQQRRITIHALQEARQEITKFINEIPRPEGKNIEMKYQNTEQFVRWCLDLNNCIKQIERAVGVERELNGS